MTCRVRNLVARAPLAGLLDGWSEIYNADQTQVSPVNWARWECTHQEILEDAGSSLVGEELDGADVGSLEHRVIDLAVLGEKSVGVWHSDVLLQFGKRLAVARVSLNVAVTSTGLTDQIPSLLFDLSHDALVDHCPDTKTLALEAVLAPTEGEGPNETLGPVESGVKDRFAELHSESHDIVVWLQSECAVQSEGVSSAGRVVQVLRRTRREERSRSAEVARYERLVWGDTVSSLSASTSLCEHCGSRCARILTLSSPWPR